MIKSKWFFTILILGFLVASCAPKASAPIETYSMDMAQQPASEMAPAPAMGEVAVQTGYEGASASVVNAGDSSRPALERIIIRNGSITLVVADPMATMDIIIQMTEERGGFVTSSNLYKTSTDQGIEVPEANITIRVPAETFNQTMQDLHNLVEDPDRDITYENTSAQDFTQEYTDLESRKANLEAAAAQLNSFMDRATTTEDVLAVYNQLTQVTEELEIIKGQMQYYEQSSAFSSITVTLIATEKIKPISVGGWQPAGVAQEALQTLVNALKVLVEIAIWIALFLAPLLIVILIPIVVVILLIRWLVKRRKARLAGKPIINPPSQDSTPSS